MINLRPPRKEPGFTDTRDFERWMYELFKKLGLSDTTFDDLDIRSNIPFLGMLHNLERKVDALERENRTLRLKFDMKKDPVPSNSYLRSKILEIENRISSIEEEIT